MTASMSSFVGSAPALVGGRDAGGDVFVWESTRDGWARALGARRLTMAVEYYYY